MAYRAAATILEYLQGNGGHGRWVHIREDLKDHAAEIDPAYKGGLLDGVTERQAEDILLNSGDAELWHDGDYRGLRLRGWPPAADASKDEKAVTE